MCLPGVTLRALGLLILVSCNGPAPYGPCTPVNCKGCCDASGVCNSGTEASACGVSGGTCFACSAGTSCAAGTCVPGSSAGGSGSTAGGDASAGGSAVAGGSGSTAGGSGSTAGGTGATAGGAGATAGGTGATAGGATAGGMATAGGATAGGATAGGATAGGIATAGGAGGTAGGTGGTAGGSAGMCSPQTCTSGCCSNNACRTPPIPAACGRNGNVCVACPQGQACSAGQCGYTGNRLAGSPCATNNDCTLGGVFGTCRTGNSWPGGYCQDTCYLLSCAGTDVCISQDCWERCPSPSTGQSTCRGGYVCLPLVLSDGGTPSYGICVPSCQVAGCQQGTCRPSGYCQ